MMNYNSRLTAVLCGILLTGMLQSCSEKENIEPASDAAKPIISASTGCPEEISVAGEWEIIDYDPPAPYDVEIGVNPTAPWPSEELGLHCGCVDEEICVTFRFTPPSSPDYRLKLVVNQGGQNQQYITRLNNRGEYQGFPILPQLPSALRRLYQKEVSLAELYNGRTICYPKGTSSIFIDFGGPNPDDFDPNRAIEQVIGLCIVDNIGDPNRP